MRSFLVPFSIAVFAIMIAWLFGGPWIALLLDRFYTVPDSTLPVGQYRLLKNEFDIGSRRWFLADDLTIGMDSRKRVTLAKDGRSFTLGPVTACCGSPNSEYDFTPDPGDQITFFKSRSWLAWPTPFEFSIMGGRMPSWRRYCYRRLLWKKSSGATLEIVWRDDQSYYSGTGWTDGYLQLAPEITFVQRN